MTKAMPELPPPEPAGERRLPRRETLEALDTSHAYVANAVQMARAWAQRVREGHAEASLVLSGPCGTGKTHIARAILWSVVLHAEDEPQLAVPAGLFYLANDLLLALAPSTDEYGTYHTPRVSRLLGQVPLLVIDDVGGQQLLPFVAKEDQEPERQARYFRLIDYCYSRRIAVILTTNLSLKGGAESDLAQHIGRRAWDRLCEMAPQGFMVGLQGVPSWRVKAGGRETSAGG